MNNNTNSNPLLLLTAVSSIALLAACSKPATPPQTEAASTEVPAADAAALAAKEAELAQREAELAQREAAVADATPAAPAPKPVVAAPKPSKPASTAASKPMPASPASPPATAAPKVITVPAGTQLSLSLSTPLTTKTAKVGDAVRAAVVSDIVVDGRTAIPAGTIVAGEVIQVISGSDKIGGVPTLGVRFARLELAGGKDIPIEGEIRQTGKSDTARDTAKIVGGAAAGAILGHQVKGGDKGKVIGGLLGGAVGAVAAQKTGTEVKLDEGTALALQLAAPVDITK
jgi:hypothetical protein